MTEGKNPRDDIEQRVMDFSLPCGELGCQCLWLADGELTDIPAARAIDEVAEGVGFFNGPGQRDSIGVAQGFLLKLVVNLVEGRRFSNEEPSPLGLCGVIKTAAGFTGPAVLSCRQ